jgi:two-component system, NarL family, nitrate/nitrite response regulator NarL
MLKIFIIDCNALFREGLSNLLEREPGIQIAGETGTIFEAIDLVKTSQPQVVLVDADDPNPNLFQEIRMLRMVCPEAQVVFLSAQDSTELLLQAVRSGARGFLPKSGSLNKLMASIHAIERGEAAVPRALVATLLDEIARPFQIAEKGEAGMLTQREMDVMRELGSGRSNRQISQNLRIAENTVKVHVHNILKKLNLRNRRQAARYARMHGMSNPIVQEEKAKQPATED